MWIFGAPSNVIFTNGDGEWGLQGSREEGAPNIQDTLNTPHSLSSGRFTKHSREGNPRKVCTHRKRTEDDRFQLRNMEDIMDL